MCVVCQCISVLPFLFYLFDVSLAPSLQCCQGQVLHLLSTYGGDKVEVVGGIKSIDKVLTNPDQILLRWLTEVYGRYIGHIPSVTVQ